jgi:hypothetical protein
VKATMPASVQDARARLTDLDRLLTATGWELAAVLASIVEPDTGHGGRETASSSHFVSAREVAKWGIRGLSSKDTVLRYVKAWLAVASRPEPGETIELPTDPWPSDENNRGSRPTTSNIGETLRANPELAKAATKALAQHDPEAVVREVVQDRPDIVARVAAEDATEETFAALRPDLAAAAEAIGRVMNGEPRERDDLDDLDDASRALGLADSVGGRLADVRRFLATANANERHHVAEGLEPYRDAVGQLIDLARGVDDADLAAALAEWSDR